MWKIYQVSKKGPSVEEKYLFIDRDGVVNEDPGGWTEFGYVTRWEDFRVIPGVIEALKKMTDAGYRIIIISNQQCVGKGYLPEEELYKLTDSIKGILREAGADVAGIYYCIHKKEDNCECRKPKSGLFRMAQDELGIKSFDGFFYIGDTQRDVEAGKSAGLKTILVLSGKSRYDDVEHWEYKPDYICKNLTEAVDTILKKGGK